MMTITHVLMLSLLAAATTPDLVRPFPSQVLRNEIVEFKPLKDHHFSLEAPQNCGEGQLVERAPRFVKCQFTKPGAAHLTLNVCDDKKTYCKPVALALTVLDGVAAGVTNARLLKNQDLNQKLKHSLVPGFTFGPPDEILKQAAAGGKPVFAMVSTDWCPPCNEAKEHLLSSPAFQKATADWFKVYIDGDSLVAADWEKYVPYRYFPSFVFLDSKFNEVARYTGNLRQGEFAAWAAEVAGDAKDPIVELKTRVLARLDGSFGQRLRDLIKGNSLDRRHRDQARLLKWALDSDDRALATRLIDQGAYPELENEISQFQLARLEENVSKTGEDNKEQHLALYRRLLSQNLTRDGWSGVLADFCGYDSKACAPELSHLDQRLNILSERPGLTVGERASQLGEEYEGLTQVYEQLGQKAEQKQAALKCVAAFEVLRSQSALKLSRAGHQGMVSCLEAAEEFTRAEAALKTLVAEYPSEPTFLQRMARVLRKAKKPLPALDWINRAETVAYGYNWFTVEMIKADILLDLKRPSDAKTLLDEALQQLPVEASQDSRNQTLVARLREKQAKVEGAGSPVK